MKICFFINSIAGGGAERTVCDLSNQLALNGHSVEILTIGNNVSSYHISSKVKVSSIYESNDHHKSKYQKIRELLTTPTKLLKYLRDHTPDILVSNLFRANLLASLLRLINNTPLVLIEHCVPSIEHKQSILNIPAMKALFPLSNKIVCVSDIVSKDYSDNIYFDTNKLCVIPNPFNPTKISNEPLEDKFIGFFNRFDFTISFTGRLAPEKNIHSLLRALKILNEQFKINVGLVIIGSGSEQSNLENTASSLDITDNTLFTGWHNTPSKIVAKTHCFVLPSHRESFGNSVVEALAITTPVCTSRIPALVELSSSEKFFKHFDQSDPINIAEVIRNILENHSIEKQHCITLRKEFLEKFDLETITAQYEHLFNSLLD